MRLVLMHTGRIGRFGFVERRWPDDDDDAVLCLTQRQGCVEDCGVVAQGGWRGVGCGGEDDGGRRWRRRRPSVFGPVLVGSDDVSLPAMFFVGWVLLTCVYMTVRVGCAHVGVPIIGCALVFVWRSLVVSGLL